MSVTQNVIDWLYQYDDIDIDSSIDTDTLAANAMAYALYRTPQKQVRPYVNGAADVTEYFNLLVRQRSQLESERADSHQWLENLETWVREQNFARNLPGVDGCYSIAVSNSFYMKSLDEKEAVYQLTIEIKYERK